MSRALLVGVVFAVACLAYVLYPLVGRRRGSVTAAPDRNMVRAVSDDEIEAAVRSYRAMRGTGRACPMCGPRPESDAAFCSNCGRRLDAAARTP
jgi:hypothetical protein